MLSSFPSPLLPTCLSSKFALAGSQLSQVIIEICGVDQTGCEDPDLDTDMTARMLHIMEQELQLVANTQCIRK